MSVFRIEEMTCNLDEHEYVQRSKDSYKRSLAMQGVGVCILIGGGCLLFLESFIGGLMFAGDGLNTTALILSMQCYDSYAWVNIFTMASYLAIASGVALINFGVIMAGFNWIAMGIGFSAVNTKKSSHNAAVKSEKSENTKIKKSKKKINHEEKQDEAVETTYVDIICPNCSEELSFMKDCFDENKNEELYCPHCNQKI